MKVILVHQIRALLSKMNERNLKTDTVWKKKNISLFSIASCSNPKNRNPGIKFVPVVSILFLVADLGWGLGLFRSYSSKLI